jgi:hypothetical protein
MSLKREQPCKNQIKEKDKGKKRKETNRKPERKKASGGLVRWKKTKEEEVQVKQQVQGPSVLCPCFCFVAE